MDRRALVVRTSSLGDVLMTLPALTDACARVPGLRFDWVVEEGIAAVPAWHPGVADVIPVAARRWRRDPGALLRGEWLGFGLRLRRRRYDRVIDAQGLMKSAVITALARGLRIGPDRHSARESWASLAYGRKVPLDTGAHAVERNRALFAAAFDYPLPDSPADYGIAVSGARDAAAGTVLFLTGTTWDTKLWPEAYWRELLASVTQRGLRVLLPWGNEIEHRRAMRIADGFAAASVLPRLGLDPLAATFGGARAALSVDSGLAHLAAAVGLPCLTLYGPTDPRRIGTTGTAQHWLRAEFPCAPCSRRRCTWTAPADVEPACFGTLPPEAVWAAFSRLLETPTPESRSSETT